MIDNIRFWLSYGLVTHFSITIRIFLIPKNSTPEKMVKKKKFFLLRLIKTHEFHFNRAWQYILYLRLKVNKEILLIKKSIYTENTFFFFFKTSVALNQIVHRCKMLIVFHKRNLSSGLFTYVATIVWNDLSVSFSIALFAIRFS